MPDALSIGGDIIDSTVVVGTNNFAVNIKQVKEGAVVNIFKPGTQPKYWARPAPIVKMPLPFPFLFGREKELRILRTAGQAGAPVSLWARQGMGKTSIARNLSHALNKENSAESIVYLDALGKGIDDLLQALFDVFFESGPSYIPGPTSIPAALQNVKALIFIDNLTLSSDEVMSLLNAAPGCVFILISTERTLWGEGEVIPLQGLLEADAVSLFEKEFTRPMDESEKEVCRQICALLKGYPDEIIRVAARAHETGTPLTVLLAELQGVTIDDHSLASLSLTALSESDKKMLALLAASGDNPVPLELLKNIFKDLDVSQELQRLRSFGLVQAHSPRFNLTGTLASTLAATWDLAPWQDTLLNYSIDLLAGPPASGLVEESFGMLLHTLRGAAERKKWPQVIQLGRLLEKFLIYFKRWQAWADVLNLILQAARASLDRGMEGWALHQLGSRALFQGALNEARSYLTQALNIRQAISDRAGLTVTSHNLDVLNGLFPPGGGHGSGGHGSAGGRPLYYYGFFGALGLFVAFGLVVLAIILYLLNGDGSKPTPEPFVSPAPTYASPTPVPPSYTPSRTPTKTPTMTPTWTPTRTPTPTITNTPAPVLLYDFVAIANQGSWYKSSYYGSPYPLNFWTATPSPSPEEYFDYSEGSYVGWDYNAPLAGDKTWEQVLLTYPYYDNKVHGDFDIHLSQSAPNAFLEVSAGYKDVKVSDSAGLIFRVYLNKDLLIERKADPYTNPSFYIPRQPLQIFEGTNSFRLEVEPASGSYSDEYGLWALVRLWKIPAAPQNNPSGPAQATFVQDANCRAGPGTSYEVVASFLQGDTVEIFGRNYDFSNTWWYVRIPNTNDYCWVSLITAQASGDFDAIPTMAP